MVFSALLHEGKDPKGFVNELMIETCWVVAGDGDIYRRGGGPIALNIMLGDCCEEFGVDSIVELDILESMILSAEQPKGRQP